MAKRTRKKITMTNVYEGVAIGKDTALTAAAVVLMQDHGFDEQAVGIFIAEAEQVFMRMLTGQPLSDERQAKADKLLERRAIKAEQELAKEGNCE